MHQFAKVLGRLLSTHDMSQVTLSGQTHIDSSKMSRLLSASTNPDRDDLAAFVQAFALETDRFDLVYAFIRDKCGDEQLVELEIKPRDPSTLHDLPTINTTMLSERSERALAYLLQMRRTIPQIEDIFIDLARALGWDGRP